MKQKKSYQSTLKWGIALGTGLAAFELVKMFARRVQYGNQPLLDLALIIGFILVLFAGIKEFKEHYTERLTFAKAFFGCMLISLIGSLIFAGYCMLHYEVVEPDGLEKKYEIALDNFKKSIAKDTITTAELTAYIDTVTKVVAAEEAKFPLPDTLDEATRAEIHTGISKITEFYQHKLIEKRSVDTTNSYVMGNVQGYSRQVLIETLQSYINQNEQKTSTYFVKQIIELANLDLSKINPVEIRYEQNKSHVPHYDKPGRYALIAAMMDLLYGMFFGLFVAMYHYTSKRKVAEMNGELPAEEKPEETSANFEEENKNN